MRTLGHLALALSLPLIACSSGISDAGHGSATLSVDGNVSAENNAVNASAPSGFDTGFSVRVTKGGAAVSGAIVEIDSDAGKIVLTEHANQGQGNDGFYGGTQAGYFRTYSLNIHSGEDYLEDVVLSGPEVHTFSAPILGAQAVSGQPLEVKWSPSGAASASIETRELDHTALNDAGSYTVPAGGLKSADPGKTEDERVRVTRSESLVPNGIVGTSTFSVSIRNEVTFLVVGM